MPAKAFFIALYLLNHSKTTAFTHIYIIYGNYEYNKKNPNVCKLQLRSCDMYTPIGF